MSETRLLQSANVPGVTQAKYIEFRVDHSELSGTSAQFVRPGIAFPSGSVIGPVSWKVEQFDGPVNMILTASVGDVSSAQNLILNTLVADTSTPVTGTWTKGAGTGSLGFGTHVTGADFGVTFTRGANLNNLFDLTAGGITVRIPFWNENY